MASFSPASSMGKRRGAKSLVLRRLSPSGLGGERIVNLWGSSFKRSRDFWAVFASTEPSPPHPEEDRFGTETFGDMHGVREPSEERRKTSQAESDPLGLLALTRWYACLQAKLGNSREGFEPRAHRLTVNASELIESGLLVEC